MATWLPKFLANRRPVTRGSRARSSSMMANERSRLPSSTKTNSQSYPSSERMTDVTASWKRRRLPSSLKTGTTTETSGIATGSVAQGREHSLDDERLVILTERREDRQKNRPRGDLLGDRERHRPDARAVERLEMNRRDAA